MKMLLPAKITNQKKICILFPGVLKVVEEGNIKFKTNPFIKTDF